MKTLKRFSSVLVLSSVLGVSVLAGEMSGPPYEAQGEVPTMPCATPGQTSTPPCEAQSNSTTPGETHGPPLSEAMIAGVWAALDLLF